MTRLKKIIATMVLAMFLGTGVVVAPLPVEASAKGRKNTAIALTALSVYNLAKGKGTKGLITGAGAAYGWKRYKDVKKK